MICVQLKGGLGNQLFQYAAGRALALRHSTDLLLDPYAFDIINSKTTTRYFELNNFKYLARIATREESRDFRWLQRLSPLSRMVSPWISYKEKSVTFDSGFHSLKNNTYLVGYWQSHNYFTDFSAELMVEISPSTPLSSKSLDCLYKINHSNSVAIHIRRGDYVSSPTASKYHGVLPLDYYYAAIQCIANNITSPQYFIFSDDPEWCRSNLLLNSSNAVFIDHNDGANAWQDLVLMSHCQNSIIANSSFSWWGAWLADQQQSGRQRLVVAPSRWFGGGNVQSVVGRFPSHWITQ